MTERILSCASGTDRRGVCEVCDKLYSCEIRKALSAGSLLRIERYYTMARPCDQNIPGKIGEARPAGYIHEKAAQRSSKEQVE